MKIIETDIEVLVVPPWLVKALVGDAGYIKHPKNPAILEAKKDPDGEFIIGIEVLSNPEWDFLGENQVKNPETGESKPIDEWLMYKKLKRYEPEILTKLQP